MAKNWLAKLPAKLPGSFRGFSAAAGPRVGSNSNDFGAAQ